MPRDIYDYYQSGAAIMKPITDRINRDRQDKLANEVSEEYGLMGTGGVDALKSRIALEGVDYKKDALSLRDRLGSETLVLRKELADANDARTRELAAERIRVQEARDEVNRMAKEAQARQNDAAAGYSNARATELLNRPKKRRGGDHVLDDIDDLAQIEKDLHDLETSDTARTDPRLPGLILEKMAQKTAAQALIKSKMAKIDMIGAAKIKRKTIDADGNEEVIETTMPKQELAAKQAADKVEADRLKAEEAARPKTGFWNSVGNAFKGDSAPANSARDRIIQAIPSSTSTTSPMPVQDDPGGPVLGSEVPLIGNEVPVGPASGRRLSPAEAAALPPGTPFIDKDGILRTRH